MLHIVFLFLHSMNPTSPEPPTTNNQEWHGDIEPKSSPLLIFLRRGVGRTTLLYQGQL